MFFMSKSSQRIPTDGGPPYARTPANTAATHTKLGVEMRTVKECGTSLANQKLLPPLSSKGSCVPKRAAKRLAPKRLSFPCLHQLELLQSRLGPVAQKDRVF